MGWAITNTGLLGHVVPQKPCLGGFGISIGLHPGAFTSGGNHCEVVNIRFDLEDGAARNAAEELTS